MFSNYPILESSDESTLTQDINGIVCIAEARYFVRFLYNIGHLYNWNGFLVYRGATKTISAPIDMTATTELSMFLWICNRPTVESTSSLHCVILPLSEATYVAFLYCWLHTYIIGHYNPSVRIIDLVSHTVDYKFQTFSEVLKAENTQDCLMVYQVWPVHSFCHFIESHHAPVCIRWWCWIALTSHWGKSS